MDYVGETWDDSDLNENQRRAAEKTIRKRTENWKNNYTGGWHLYRCRSLAFYFNRFESFQRT